MNFLALIPIFTTIFERLFPDKEKAAEAALAMQQALYAAQAESDKAKRDIIVTELNSGSIASNWRAYLMLVCISIVGYNWMVVSLLNAFLAPLGCPITAIPVPTELWTLVSIGLGGYLGKETISSYSNAKYGAGNNEKFYDILRQKIFKSGLSQEQVTAIEDALKARDAG